VVLITAWEISHRQEATGEWLLIAALPTLESAMVIHVLTGVAAPRKTHVTLEVETVTMITTVKET